MLKKRLKGGAGGAAKAMVICVAWASTRRGLGGQWSPGCTGERYEADEARGRCAVLIGRGGGAWRRVPWFLPFRTVR
jgi:hypothetical protein